MSDNIYLLIAVFIGILLDIFFFGEYKLGILFVIWVSAGLILDNQKEIKKNQELILEKMNKEDDKTKEPEI